MVTIIFGNKSFTSFTSFDDLRFDDDVRLLSSKQIFEKSLGID